MNKLLPLLAFSVLLLAPVGAQNAFAGITMFDDIIFDNGGVSPTTDGGQAINTPTGTPFTAAEDFILDGDFFVTDIHFVVNGNPANFDILSFQYFILSDSGGSPGNILASGNAMDLEVEPVTGTLVANVWFNLEEPFEAEEGVTYWIGIHETNVVGSGIGWTFGTTGQGEGSHSSAVLPPTTWVSSVNNLWFLLSGHPPDVVGGELLPIDSTALLLAGLQSSAIWMLPVLAGAAGAGIAAFKLRRK